MHGVKDETKFNCRQSTINQTGSLLRNEELNDECILQHNYEISDKNIPLPPLRY